MAGLGTIAAMPAAELPRIDAFKGLNNVTDPMRLGLGWLVTGNNINISDTGALSRRAGFTLSQAGSYSGAYATLDYQRLYLATGTEIVTPEGAVVVTGLSDAPMYWCEINSQVFYNNGTDSGIINPDHSVLPWRASTLTDIAFLDAAGNALSALLDPLPLGATIIQAWKGRIYAAQYMPGEDQTVIWYSQPLGYHLFALDKDFIVVSGKVTMLAPHDSALLIGTDSQIHAYDGNALKPLAPYGALPGQHWSEDDSGRILFWSARGLCAALPFTNLTEKNVSVAPGVSAGGAIVRDGGQTRYVVALQQGGSAFNAFS